MRNMTNTDSTTLNDAQYLRGYGYYHLGMRSSNQLILVAHGGRFVLCNEAWWSGECSVEGWVPSVERREKVGVYVDEETAHRAGIEMVRKLKLL